MGSCVTSDEEAFVRGKSNYNLILSTYLTSAQTQVLSVVWGDLLSYFTSKYLHLPGGGGRECVGSTAWVRLGAVPY